MASTYPLKPAAAQRPALLRTAPFREVFGIDLRTLAAFRVGLGGLILADLILRARDLRAHYTDFGVFPRDVLVQYLNPAAWSLHIADGGLWFQAVLFAAAGVFAVMLMLGWRTRLVTIASWALLLSLQNRNPLILSGQDNLILLLAFWAMFLPLGARFSVDAALRHEPTPDAPNAYLSVATAALLVQGMSMYLFSALLKSDPQWIPDGTAVHYALQLDYFATPFALWLRQFDGLLKVLTWYVWTVELVGPFLIFCPVFHRPLRMLFLGVFVTMHAGFWFCLEIGLFPAVSILMNLAFLPGHVWDRLGAIRAERRRGLAVFYDIDCGFCLRTCRLLATFLILPGVPIRPAQQDAVAGPLLQAHGSWVVRGADGRHRLKWDAFRHLVACSPLFFPLAGMLALGPVMRAGAQLYDRVGANRPRLGRITAALLPYRPVRVAPGAAGSAVAAVAMVFVFAQNLSTLPGSGVSLPATLVAARQALGLYQNWTMFAPHPEMNSPWPVIVGALRDGTIVDVYNRVEGLPDLGTPPVVSAVYQSHHWRKYLTNLEDRSYGDGPPDYGLHYARWLCRAWNERAMPGRELSRFKIFFNVKWSQAPGAPPADIETRLVWTHDCFG